MLWPDLSDSANPGSVKVPAEVDRATCRRWLIAMVLDCWPNVPAVPTGVPGAAFSVLASWPMWMLRNVAVPADS